MSYLKKEKDACGRYVPKPIQIDNSAMYEDEGAMPIQDQIDNLRAKISLKEKYNKALEEELHESNAGAASMITDLSVQNKELRDDLEAAKFAEKDAVKKALRSYRFFQLAVNAKTAEGVIEWLDDKLFDLSKALNLGVYKLKLIQTKLLEAEANVQHLEKSPLPGNEPWELKITEITTTLENNIEAGRANVEAASVLNRKYKEILDHLKMERGKWPNITCQLEKTLRLLQDELVGLEAMYEDAKRFRDEAREKLELTEEEASENRKQRRGQMMKMKKSVQKALDANTTKYAAPAASTAPSTAAVPQKTELENSSSRPLNDGQEILVEIKKKQTVLQEYEDTVNKLVDIMRVRDLRDCPKRLKAIKKLGVVMEKELAMQEEMKDLLTKHKYRLQLILYYLRYTGDKKRQEYYEEVEKKEHMLKEISEENAERTFETSQDGEVLVNLRFVMIGLEEMLLLGKKKHPDLYNTDLYTILDRIVDKIEVLVESLDNLRSMFTTPPQRSYAPYVKVNYMLTPRNIRCGSLEEQEQDDSDPELDIPDSNIPNRQELKHASDKFLSQALLRRGIH